MPQRAKQPQMTPRPRKRVRSDCKTQNALRIGVKAAASPDEWSKTVLKSETKDVERIEPDLN